ncbi:MAG: Fpg/Nei family DNA glycosylase [Armatimonadota bacterium]
MAELPEIHKFRRQMDAELSGKRIQHLHLLQEKCLNIPADEFQRRCHGAKILGVQNKGKWFLIKLENHENILLSLGMGGDLLYLNGSSTDAKYQIKLDFDDGTCFTIRFWWFGRFMIVSDDALPTEPNTSRIAMDPFDESFTYEYFRQLFTGKRTQIKPFLLDQKNISGIGNMYMHDILFSARLHPQTKISDISELQFTQLYHSILDTLRRSEGKGAFSYEKDIYGNPGGFTIDDFLVGYRENGSCPVCGHAIEQIKTGSTTSYICPVCQRL